MAEVKKILTWKEKLDQGVPLNTMDEVKADADFNYRRRLREEEERLAFEKLKSGGRPDAGEADDASGNEDKKGNK
jgi:hypothetical protein